MALTKKQELQIVKDKNYKLMKMIGEEREKVAGYEQIAKLYGAYIAILLEKLGATQDKPVNISKADATGAMSRIEARAMSSEDGWCLYCEVVKD